MKKYTDWVKDKDNFVFAGRKVEMWHWDETFYTEYGEVSIHLVKRIVKLVTADVIYFHGRVNITYSNKFSKYFDEPSFSHIFEDGENPYDVIMQVMFELEMISGNS
jgi:hypothetical protein